MTKPNYVPGPKEQELTGKIIRLHYNSEAAWLPMIAAFNEARAEIVATTRIQALKDAAKVSCGYCQNGFEVELTDGCEFTHNNGTTSCTAEYIWRLMEGWYPDAR